MVRLTIIFLVLIVQLAIETASTYQTVLTTTEVDESLANQYPSQRCQQEHVGVDMNWCRHYLLKYIRLETQELERRCCEQLVRINPECRCDAVRQTLQSAIPSIAAPEGQRRQEKMQEMVRDAQHMPRMCRLMEPEYCHIPQKIQ